MDIKSHDSTSSKEVKNIDNDQSYTCTGSPVDISISPTIIESKGN